MAENATRRKRREQPSPILVIGWHERVDLPDWGIRGLRAKVDTGARTSSVHVDNLVELPNDHVRFDVVVRRGHTDRKVRVQAPVVRHGRVRSSTGRYQTRIFVETTLRVGGEERTIELNLTDRGDLRFRMLLGRTALASWNLLIDPSRSALASPRPKRRRKDAGP